jgi:uncharacterized protein (DUF4415 family)
VEFEWDEPKRLSNIAKHGIDFRDATLLFESPHVIERSRSAINEERWLAVGTIDNDYVTTIFTRRGSNYASSQCGDREMEKKEDIRRYTSAELKAMRARGESQTDWARVRAKSEEELERDIADDPDYRDVPDDWYKNATLVMPTSKKMLSLRLDSDILDWFKQQGPGYQTRINAVLRAYAEQAKKRRA